MFKLLVLRGGVVKEMEAGGLWNHRVETFQRQLYKQISGQERSVNWTDGLGNQQRTVVFEVLDEMWRRRREEGSG